MVNHNSAPEREGTSHTNKSPQRKTLRPKQTITAAIKRRAQSLMTDRSLDPQTRALIRYSLETSDPWLPELVRRTEAGQSVRETIGLLATSEQ